MSSECVMSLCDTQIRLWEGDMVRVRQTEAVLYEDFPSEESFGAVEQYARDRGALCFAHLPSRRIAVSSNQ